MSERSRLVRMGIWNLGCIGPEGLAVELDDILCLVGPNNTGKSTVLRAYELAAGKATFTESDLCKRAGEAPAAVELWVHIPEGTPNIAEKWKVSDGALRLVRSRWEWKRENGWRRERSTWDPEIGDWAADTKAAGLDEVFTSRLPIPLRVGTLQDPEEEHKALLMLVLQPIAERLRLMQLDAGSELRKALNALADSANKPVQEERERIRVLKDDLNRAQSQIFPHLSVDLSVELGSLEVDLKSELIKHSGVRFTEWSDEVRWSQQGTGSQRALFWALLQVRSRLQVAADLQTGKDREASDIKKKIAKLEKDEQTVKREGTKTAKRQEIERLRKDLAALEAPASTDSHDLKLPGHMLLIDEPEVGLHPAAIRAASRYLYGLADDPAWQVVLSSHAPLFVDPLQDHTTIVRLSRSEANPTPHTYRASSVAFSADERENLKMLNRFDSAVAEMFFGQLPILIEGDTEFASFEWIVNGDRMAWPIGAKPLLVRARGKQTLVPLVRMLKHFRVPFSVLHDSDTPRRSDGSANAAWTANAAVHREIAEARAAGIRVVHRVSIPGFELAHLPVETDTSGFARFPVETDKPWRMLTALSASSDAAATVKRVLEDLVSPSAPEGPFDGEFAEGLSQRVADWAAKNSPGDPRFAVTQK